MATVPTWLAATSRTGLLTKTFLRPFSSLSPLLAAKGKGTGGSKGGIKNVSKEKAAKDKARRKRKKHSSFKQYNLTDIQQFTLCDAMRYIRAFEVGRPPTVPKYECHVRLRTKKDGPVIRSQIRLPHTVKSDIKICVICPPDSRAAQQAREAGASLVGEEEVFEIVKSGKFDFDRCLAQPKSLEKINKAGLGRILGPRGLMPSIKLGTVVDAVGTVVKAMLGGGQYRERRGVVSMPVGQAGFTPEQLRDNIQTFIGQVRQDAVNLSDQLPKSIHEVVLSSTNSPGFSLNGEFRSESSPSVKDLSKW